MNPYNIIAKHFWDLLDDCLKNGHTHYWLKGGRRKYKIKFYRYSNSSNDDVRCEEWSTIKYCCNEKSR